MIEQALEVGGDKYIHRRGNSCIELSVPVVNARVDEIGEDVVAVGGADELVYGNAHQFRVVCGKDIAEVARGDNDVYFLAELYFLVLDELRIGGNIVNDLRRKSAPVDGVRAGKQNVVLREPVGDLLVGEYLLYAVLTVVKVALDSADVNVIALLRGHLALLHTGHAVLGVENAYRGAVNVLEAFESRLAGVARCCDEYRYLLAVNGLFC